MCGADDCHAGSLMAVTCHIGVTCPTWSGIRIRAFVHAVVSWHDTGAVGAYDLREVSHQIQMTQKEELAGRGHVL